MPKQSLTAMRVAFGAREQATTIALILSFLLVQITGVVIFSQSAKAVGPVSYSHSITSGFDGALGNPRAVAISPQGDYYYILSSDDNKLHKYQVDGTPVASWSPSGPGSYTGIRSLAVDSQGNIYGTDSYKVYQFNPSDGSEVASWGDTSPGNVGGEFNNATDLSIDKDDNIYVADPGQSYVFKFLQDGTYQAEWGGFGSGDNNFLSPTGIVADNRGSVYVADAVGAKIKKYTTSGTFITKWGSSGSGNGQFQLPYDVSVDGAGQVYVAEAGPSNRRVQKFAADGTFITKWGSSGSSAGQFNFTDPYTSDNVVQISARNNSQVYVVDPGNTRVQVFNDNSFDLRLTTEDPVNVSTAAATVKLQSTDLAGLSSPAYSFDYGTTTSYGSSASTYDDWVDAVGTAQLNNGTAIGALIRDRQGATYVTDSNCHVLKFDADGNYEHTLGSVCAGNSTAANFSWFVGAAAVDLDNNIYIGETTNSQYIKKFASDGTYLGYIDAGSDISSWGVASLAVDSQNNLYMGTASTTRKIYKFDKAGNAVTDWGSAGTGDGQFNSTGVYVAVDSSGDVYARNGNPNRIQHFEPNGTYVGEWSTSNLGGGLFIDQNNVVYAGTSSVVTMYNTAGTILDTASIASGIASLQSLHVTSPAAVLETIDTTSSTGAITQSARLGFADITGLDCGTTYHYRAKAVVGGDAVYGADNTFTTDACFAITTTSLPDGTVGTSYSQTVEANRANVTFVLDSGSLPAGLSINSAGLISGTPTAAGTYNFTIEATDTGTSDTDTQALQIIVNPAPADPFEITTTSLPDGLVGDGYEAVIQTDSDNPITFSLFSGTLPAGVSLSSAGTLSGTPTTAGEFTFTVLATDGEGSDSQQYTVTISAAQVAQPEEPTDEEPPPLTDVTPTDEAPHPTDPSKPAQTSPVKSLQQAATGQNSLFALVQQIPAPIALGFPWLLLILALILVSIQYYQVRSEQAATKRMQASLAYQKQLVEEQNNFVALSTHYLHTPLTVMEGEITLMAKAGTITQAQATKLKATLASLNSEAETVIAQEDQHESTS